MASVSEEAGGNRRIQFMGGGKRQSIRVGKMSLRLAESIARRVEQILAATLANRPLESDTACWIAELDDVMADKFARAGLIPKREEGEAITLAPFIDAYIESRTDVKPLTLRHLKDARRSLVEFFGASRPLAAITPGDADEYRRWLLTTLGENTVRRRCGRAKQFFRVAIRKRVIAHDPFGDMKGCQVKANKARDHFIDRTTAAAVLAACPDAEWRLIFALARFGGLRIPSELLTLKWSDINWERNRFTVRSSKTEHHEGGGVRIVPIFPELLPHLNGVWDAAADQGSEFVITRHRTANVNLRTQLERILTQAGVKPWPKLFQNLRASRATELAATNAVHVAAEWLGHSALVAQKHYWRVTEADFEQATKAVQNPTLQLHETACNDSLQPNPEMTQSLVAPGFASLCSLVHESIVPRVGLEPTTH